VEVARVVLGPALHLLILHQPTQSQLVEVVVAGSTPEALVVAVLIQCLHLLLRLVVVVVVGFELLDYPGDQVAEPVAIILTVADILVEAEILQACLRAKETMVVDQGRVQMVHKQPLVAVVEVVAVVLV
jgi:hypothetical protein